MDSPDFLDQVDFTLQILAEGRDRHDQILVGSAVHDASQGLQNSTTLIGVDIR